MYVYKAGAFTYFSALKKSSFPESMFLPNISFDVINTGKNKYFDDLIIKYIYLDAQQKGSLC